MGQGLSDAPAAGASVAGSVAARPTPTIAVVLSTAIAVVLAVGAWWLAARPDDGRALAFSIAAGGLFGLVLQRSRFCFYCNARDFLERRDARGLLGIVVALLVGTVGYHAVFGAFLPIARAPGLPPGAHIGPVSWVLAAGALAFGLGMAVSGSCISAHLYRLGEGAVASMLALLGAMVGFALGFASWNTLYLSTIQAAPVVWLPHFLGYGGSLLVQAGLLAAIAAWLLRHHRRQANELGSARASPDGVQGPGSGANQRHASNIRSIPVSSDMPRLGALLFGARWPAYVGGVLVAAIGVVAYFRVAPLGVTAELGSLARTAAASQGWLPDRLEGLDSFAGCATAVKNALLSRNGVFVIGLVLASFASALLAGDFRPKWPGLADAVRAVGGGILMGWGAMVALGCTVGTLLSGIMAGALSGWVFAAASGAGLVAGWWLRSRRWHRTRAGVIGA